MMNLYALNLPELLAVLSPLVLALAHLVSTHHLAALAMRHAADLLRRLIGRRQK